MSLFGPCLFRACDILVVQSDGWDRYCELATLCFELGCPAGADKAESKFAPRGARLARFAAVATVGEAFSQLYCFERLATAQHSSTLRRAQETLVAFI